MTLQAQSSVCPRPASGSTVQNPPELQSKNGTLELNLYFRGDLTHHGESPIRYCYMTDAGLESPTLRVKPGDILLIHFQNQLGGTEGDRNIAQGGQPPHQKLDCSDMRMSPDATNLHFHGLNIAPLCHQDEVLHTLIQAGESFDYRIVIPKDETPGLYWYHPHIHGFTERQVQGGASGALIVENPSTNAAAKYPERILILRDQPLSDISPSEKTIPAWDVSVNYVPVLYKQYVPAKLEVAPDTKEFWRVLNASAGTILDLQVIQKREAFPLHVVAMDGVPVDATTAASVATNLVLPPASRVEFLVTTPPSGQQAQLVTRAWNTGLRGDIDPSRPLANIVAASSDQRGAGEAQRESPLVSQGDRVVDLRAIKPTGTRKLYFSELAEDPNDPDALTYFFLTVAGQRPAPYTMQSPPNIVANQGTVEDWVIENRALEDHVFHTHQLHFQILEVNGKAVNDREIRDTVNVEHWSGAGPYPSVRVRMDFRAPNLVGGIFPYHCHLLRHEDMGMMGTIQIVQSAKGIAASGQADPSAQR